MNEKEKPLKVEFAEGCFDGFEGTQDELNELVADLKTMIQSGALWENSLPLSAEEEEELVKMLTEREKRQ